MRHSGRSASCSERCVFGNPETVRVGSSARTSPCKECLAQAAFAPIPSVSSPPPLLVRGGASKGGPVPQRSKVKAAICKGDLRLGQERRNHCPKPLPHSCRRDAARTLQPVPPLPEPGESPLEAEQERCWNHPSWPICGRKANLARHLIPAREPLKKLHFGPNNAVAGLAPGGPSRDLQGVGC